MELLAAVEALPAVVAIEPPLAHGAVSAVAPPWLLVAVAAEPLAVCAEIVLLAVAGLLVSACAVHLVLVSVVLSSAVYGISSRPAVVAVALYW